MEKNGKRAVKYAAHIMIRKAKWIHNTKHILPLVRTDVLEIYHNYIVFNFINIQYSVCNLIINHILVSVHDNFQRARAVPIML